MRAIDKKLLRDLYRLKGQVVAIVLVVTCGVATFVSSLSTYQSLSFSQRSYYDHYRFAHLFAQLKRAPERLRDRMREIPGVSEVETRVVVDVTLDVEGLVEPAVGRLVSIPANGVPRLNRLYLRSGRLPDPRSPKEALVIEGFATAHGLRAGDTVAAVINGKRQDLWIVGVALSPEYVYPIKAGDMMPDDKRFGVFWMGREALSAAYDMRGSFNDIVLTLSQGGSERDVIAALDTLLAPYGNLGAYGRYHQTSNRFLSDEIASLEATGVMVPIIFLGVAAFLLHVVLSRLISTQREQIAALKALGYSNGAIGLHYLKLVVLIALLGSVSGVAVGAWVGREMTVMYTQFFRFPALNYHLGADVILLSALVSFVAAVFGVTSAVVRAVRLPPAEAMRPAAPPKYRRSIIDRLGLQRLWSPAGRMVVRNVARRPVRAFLSSLAIAFAVAMIVVGWFFMDSMDQLLKVSLEFAYRDDVTVAFTHPISDRALRELEHLPGVRYAEPFRVVPMKLRTGHRERRLALFGLPQDGKLRRLLDEDLVHWQVPDQGVLLTEKLGAVLHLRVGDTLTLEALEGARPVRQVRVAGLVKEPIGVSMYASLENANRWMQESAQISGAYLAVDSAHLDEVCTRLKKLPYVAGVTLHDAMIDAFEKTTKEYLVVFSFILVLFAVVIVAGVVYNSGRIALAERERELASLRVMGFTRAEISFILLGEIGVQVLLSIPLGLGLGTLLSAWIARAYDTELYRLPVVIEGSTYAFAVVVLLASSVLTGLLVSRRLGHLDLVAVLKTRE